jgi:23S rRNA (cytosine1962-C5)-methyltransferase
MPHTDCYRAVHREWSENPKLVVEVLGESLQILNYSEKEPPSSLVSKIVEELGSEQWVLRQMVNRGGSSGAVEKSASKNESKSNILSMSDTHPETWTVTENKMKFELRLNQGLTCGLFLDQRNNRNKVLHSSEGLRVANLFSYTCGFSVAAALGGAHEVVSVDTSSASLDWGKQNFTLNGLNPDKYEFFTADSGFFLDSCAKRKREFDVIILDPPTFSRSKMGSFQLKKDLSGLLTKAFKVLSENGRVLITLNDEEINGAVLSRMIEKAATDSQLGPVLFEKVNPPYDFEFPLERDTVLKGFWVSRP